MKSELERVSRLLDKFNNSREHLKEEVFHLREQLTEATTTLEALKRPSAPSSSSSSSSSSSNLTSENQNWSMQDIYLLIIVIISLIGSIIKLKNGNIMLILEEQNKKNQIINKISNGKQNLITLRMMVLMFIG